jgi:hypothetical protein
MTSRQRLQAALNHQQPDAVPIDFGGTFITGMHCSCVAALRDHFGLERRPVKVHEPYQMLGLIEDDLKDAMGIDVDGVFPPKTIFGFSNDAWKPWRTPWGQQVLVSTHFEVFSDQKTDDTYIFPKGDRSAPPSGHMPRGGFFFDAIIRQPPIKEDELDPADNLEEFGPLSDAELATIVAQVEARRGSERGSIFATPGTGLGDIALVPAPFLAHPRGIRDVAEWYMSTVTRQDYIHKVFAAQCEIAIANLERIHDAVGDAFDVVVTCGTDFGTQTSQFCSLDTLRSLWLPYYRRVNDWIHRHTQWKIMKHSCGAVEPFIDTLIEAGFDILNPVQCSASGMDPRHLKQRYGDRIVFWGGGIDTQKLLPFGTPDEVRRQVLERLEIFSAGGGFVFNAIHNVQARTPVENIVAMLDAFHEFNGTTVRAG